MAVEYETTPSTPGNPGNTSAMFLSAGNAVKKRATIKHMSQENFRAGLFFCGKRKRSHRERYHDYDHHRLHSSSVPRQREFFTPKNSYLEYKNRKYPKPCERILPLNKNIISKIEKISQDSGSLGMSSNAFNTEKPSGFAFNPMSLTNGLITSSETPTDEPLLKSAFVPLSSNQSTFQVKSLSIDGTSNAIFPQKSGSFDSTFSPQDATDSNLSAKGNAERSRKSSKSRHKHHKRKQSRRQLKMQIQFDDPNGMECGNFNDFLSSSSLSSSDSEAGLTNESDREGDDELTDWPGNEELVNFASKNDFKRAKPSRSNAIGSSNNKLSSFLHGKGGNDDVMVQDEDTLMSADELRAQASHLIPNSSQSNESDTLRAPDPLIMPMKFSASNDILVASSSCTSNNNLLQDDQSGLRSSVSLPINIAPQQNTLVGFQPRSQIESEMSGETSNYFLSSPMMEVREIRAGCRRIRDERPGFTIFSSVNEHLSRFVCTNSYKIDLFVYSCTHFLLNCRFLQDSRQSQLILAQTNEEENGKLADLAKLYSLKMEFETGRTILYKTM